jgi:hypothetical protein
MTLSLGGLLIVNPGLYRVRGRFADGANTSTSSDSIANTYLSIMVAGVGVAFQGFSKAWTSTGHYLETNEIDALVTIAANQRVQLGMITNFSGYTVGGGWKANLKVESMF